ncbi:MAG TPA: D-alanyl-D-alanine carboxypeptidase [Peptococcaceae bacterium]|nr:MAG: Serine-type D-Ala-D-Ala carboxypeptidase [Moorella sp. 60_41]HBT47806.1 D-alanyl-D-alanine carboxypeptidase [Peptococcaceae bacterium]
MFWRLRVLPWLFLCLSLPRVAWGAEEPLISAPWAALMEARTGQFLYTKNAHAERPPASTTKVLTAILALELGRLDAEVTVSEYAATTPGASIDLVAGTTWRLEALIKGALMNSGNDATVAIAEHLAGSEETFAWMMNRKSRLLGAFRSHFVNPNGLPADGHYSTAHDLAVMSRYALQHPVFRRIVATLEDEINGYPDQQRLLYNTNRLLTSYPGADGVKTGTTEEAGHCLVASATREGRQLIAVVLRSWDRYEDAGRLLDYGFTAFHLEQVEAGQRVGTVYVPNGRAQELPVVSAADVAWSVPVEDMEELEKRVLLPRTVKAPVNKGQVLGTIQFLYRGEEVASAPLVAAGKIRAESWLSSFLKGPN